MIGFLQEYVKNDNVGILASAHLVHADMKGIFSRKCQSIAAKFSIAVDFVKNGQTQQLAATERPTRYPDFMENDRQVEYRSQKALGKIYRICKHFESENEAASMKYENVQVNTIKLLFI